MTCLLDEGLDGPGMKSHTSLLGTFFLYALGPRMPIFKKKSSLKRLGKSSKLFIVVTLLNTYNEKFGAFSQTFQARFFLENWHTQSQGIYKKGPQHRSMRLHSWLVQNFADLASHSSTLLIRWLHYCTRVYVYTQLDPLYTY